MRKLRESDRGQGMVEFVLLLFVIMALCTGMLASMRLLTFQFWAQQEARYIAFEQTSAPHSFYTDPENEPISDLENGEPLGRPKIVSDRDADKKVEDDGASSGILASLADSVLERSVTLTERPIGEVPPDGADAPVMLAKNDSIWTRKTKDWFGKARSFEESVSLVRSAVASQIETAGDGAVRSAIPDTPLEEEEVVPTSAERIELAVERILERADFGEKFCSAIGSITKQYGHPEIGRALAGEEGCADRMSRKFAEHLVRNVDIMELYKDYDYRLQQGLFAGEGADGALEAVMRDEVGNQFYSFFDTLTKTARIAALPFLIGESVSFGADLTDSSITNMVTRLRYVGSSIAVTAITGVAVVLGAQTFGNPTPQEIIDRENDFNDILHTDADTAVPGGIAFFLGPQALPLPPTWGAVGMAMQEGVMQNVLAEDDDLVDPLIQNSNKMVEVSYKARGGLFNLATQKVRGVEDAVLTSRFYLITQEWHIPRRISASGDYRQKGTQTDLIDEDTEEAVLRRRVSGLWFFPSDIVSMLRPISFIPGLDVLAPVFDAIEPVGEILGTLKSFLLVDNPIFNLINTLNEIPVLNLLIPDIPAWPAVRPDAYPGSEELTGNDPDEKDKLMGSDREFKDYVDEQREFNPPPKPEFND